MNDRQFARFTKNENVAKFWDDRASLTSGIPSFAPVFADFKLNIAAVKIKGKVQLTDTSELVDLKNAARIDLVQN